MGRYVTNRDIINIPKGTVIEISDYEMSYYYKGKGWFLHIYKDSDIISFKYPDKLFKPIPESELTDKRYTEEELDVYKYEFDNKYSRPGNILRVMEYKDLISKGYMPVYEDALLEDDIVFRITPSGNKILGIAKCEVYREIDLYTGLNTDLNYHYPNPNIFIPVHDYDLEDGAVRANRVYILNKGANSKSFYTKAISYDNIDDSLRDKLEDTINRAYKGKKKLDHKSMRLVNVLKIVKE